MPTVSEILSDPDYINANAATKQAIFNQIVGSDIDFQKANDATKSAVMSAWGLAPAEPAKPPPKAGFSAADTAISLGQGIVGVGKSIADVFGADTAASKKLASAQESLAGMMSPERQKELAYERQQEEAAAKEGTMAEMKTIAQNILSSPIQSTAQAIGSIVPNLLSLLIPGVGEARAAIAARTVFNVVLGAAEGTGAVKGSIYDNVTRELVNTGMKPEEAASIAAKAQSYASDNLAQIGLGTLIGGVTGKYGVEELLSGAGRGAAKKLATVGGEAVTEGGQAAQEQIASNIALQKEGFDVDTMKGVAGAATREGLMGVLGAGVAAPFTPGRAPTVEPVKESDIPLLLEGKGAFTPVGLPDGSVAMTREDLARYEEDKFKKKYEPQSIEQEKLMLEHQKFPFTPVALPDGSVALTREDLARYEEEQFQKKYAPQEMEKAAEVEPTVEAARTEAAPDYATATKEIEALKNQKQTPEIKARITKLQNLKMESVMDRLRAAKEDISPELKILRKQMEEGQLTYEGQQRAIDKALAEFYQKTKVLTGKAAPATSLDQDIKDLTKDAKALSAEFNKYDKGPLKGKSLKSFVAGALDPKDVLEIGPVGEFKYLLAKPDAKKQTIEDLVVSGTVDEYLPYDLRMGVRTVDQEADAIQEIRDRIKEENFKPYDVQENLRRIGNELDNVTSKIDELKTETKIQEEVAALPAEKIQESIAETAPQAGFTGALMPTEGAPVEAYEGMPPPKAITEKPTEVKYMQAKVGEKGMSKAAADKVVNRIKSTWINAPDIEVVQSLNELPQEIQDQITKDKVNPRGVYDPDTKKVWLVADNLPTDAQVAITLAHEALGHFGLRAILGNNFSKMMSDIYAGNKNVRDRADAYIKEGMDKETATEEILAEMAQEVYDMSIPADKLKSNRTALQKIMNVIRQFLAKLGVPMRTISDETVLDLIRNARHAVVKGKDVAPEMMGGKKLYSIKETAGAAAEKAKEAVRRAGQKRQTMDRGAFKGVPEDIIDKINNTFFPENKTIVDKIEGLRDNFWKKVAQGVADQYRSIKDYTEEGYMLARLSKTIDGALEGLLFNGQVTLKDGALDIKQNTKGLMQALEPVGEEVDRYQVWVAANRDARLPEDKRSINKDIVRNRATLAEGTLNGKSRLDVYTSVQKEMNALNKSVLDIAFKQGLIDQDAYDRFSNDIFYIPFYKAMEDGDLQGASTATGLTSQYFSKELKGGERPFGDLMENTLRNWSHILSASMKNQAAKVTMDAAMDLNAAFPNLKPGLNWEDGKVYSSKTNELVGDGSLKPEYTKAGKGMVKIMMGGKEAYFEVVDPMLLESIMSIGYMGPKSKFLNVAKDFKNLLQFGVTVSPAFKVRNLFRDSIQSMAVSDMSLNPFTNVIRGWALSDRNNPAHISALAGGAIFNFGSQFEGDQGALIKRMLKAGIKSKNILDTEGKIKAGLANSWRAYQDLGNKSEAANRMSLFQQMRDKGMTHLEASFYARDLLDFSMQGAWPAFRLVTQVVPFLNARVQGLYKLGKDGVMPTSRVIYNTVTGKPIELSDKKKAQQFSIVTGSVVMASMMLYLAFKDDEEFKKREDWDRDNFWWMKLPGMDAAIRVPKPFEIGAFGTMAERTLEQIIDKGAEGKQFEDSIKRMLSDTFALNPTPQMIKPLVDLYANKDSFTGAPIETAGMERLSKAERASDMTSPLGIALSAMQRALTPESMEMSPVQVDYAIKSYFGWLGGTITQSSHYAVMPFAQGAYPDTKMTDTLSMGFIKELPSTQSKYVTAFYENSKQISQAYADMRHYAELGESEKVQQIIEEKGDMIAMQKFYDKSAKDMAKIRKVISIVRNDKEMTGAQKTEEIDRLKMLIGMVAEQAESARKSVKESMK